VVGGARRGPGEFEQPWPQKEHHARIVGRAELPVDRQTQHVLVETSASAQVGGAHQDPATQDLHSTIVAAVPPRTGFALQLATRAMTLLATGADGGLPR